MRSVKRLSPDEARQVLLNALDQIATSDRLLAAVRERDNTIARVRGLHQPRVNSTSALYPKPLCTCNSTYPCATIAALDPQETPDGRM